MKIVSLTMIGNESEIIESFIRYNSNFIDKMVLVSTCCIDNTNTIIRNLIKEGYNVELIEESKIYFEQRMMDNNYTKKLARENQWDLLIPLDADEFLMGTKNPREILESLELDRIYEITWKNYAMTLEDDMAEGFIPKRMRYFKKNFNGNDIPKVIIPLNLVLKKHVIMETGHHAVFGEGIVVQRLEELKMAHYPTTSEEQYKLKIFGNGIRFITWMNRANEEGHNHNRQMYQLETGADVFKLANGYGLDAEENIELVDEPMDLSFCKPETLQIKYAELAKVDFVQGLYKTGQLMAIKSYNMEMDAREDGSKLRILIFGTGYAAANLMNGLPENCVNIRAYIDNNPEKKFRMYNRRLIITPSWVRFFQFDKVIISSRQYYDEMKKDLLDNGVAEDKICGIDYLFDYMLEQE